MRRAAVLLFAAVALGCDDATIPREQLALRIDTDRYEVRLAQGFALTVTRSWDKGLVPEPWDDETLSPLVVRQEELEIRENERFVQETRRFRALAVELGDVRVLPPLVVATAVDGGGEVVTSGEPLDLRVTPAMPPGDATDVELPGGLLAPRRPWVPWLILVGAALIVALVVARRRPRSVADTVLEPFPEPPVDPPDVIALRALDAAELLAADDDPRPLHDAVSGVLREYVRVRFGAGTAESTTEELLAAARACGVPQLDDLRALMWTCAMVRFGGLRADGDARARVVSEARVFITGTSAGAATGGVG